MSYPDILFIIFWVIVLSILFLILEDIVKTFFGTKALERCCIWIIVGLIPRLHGAVLVIYLLGAIDLG